MHMIPISKQLKGKLILVINNSRLVGDEKLQVHEYWSFLPFLRTYKVTRLIYTWQVHTSFVLLIYNDHRKRKVYDWLLQIK